MRRTPARAARNFSGSTGEPGDGRGDPPPVVKVKSLKFVPRALASVGALVVRLTPSQPQTLPSARCKLYGAASCQVTPREGERSPRNGLHSLPPGSINPRDGITGTDHPYPLRQSDTAYFGNFGFRRSVCSDAATAIVENFLWPENHLVAPLATLSARCTDTNTAKRKAVKAAKAERSKAANKLSR
jgi:hypothetical protein